ncbi:MAG: response regulator transcription factor [Candidatus Lokiarchaeota archaeon]|nr:response regulator transcription factor [Candidatus Lokiarchaeota archaeon]
MIETKKKTILIVDDEPDIVNLTDKFLKLGGFKTLSCNNGKDALNTIETNHDEIKLVLLDVMMPGLSGFDILKEIKSNSKYDDILVVLFTVKSFNEDIQKGRSLGANGYLTKPFSGKELLKYVQDKIGN